MTSIQKIKKDDHLLLLGHRGLIGSALLKQLKKKNYKNIITVSKKKINLLSLSRLNLFFKKKKTENCYYCCGESRWYSSQ